VDAISHQVGCDLDLSSLQFVVASATQEQGCVRTLFLFLGVTFTVQQCALVEHFRVQPTTDLLPRQYQILHIHGEMFTHVFDRSFPRGINSNTRRYSELISVLIRGELQVFEQLTFGGVSGDFDEQSGRYPAIEIRCERPATSVGGD
jgi:hypothetical protein